MEKFSSFWWKTNMIQTCEKSSRFCNEYSTLFSFDENVDMFSMSMIPLESGETVGWRGLPFFDAWHDRTYPIGRKSKLSTDFELWGSVDWLDFVDNLTSSVGRTWHDEIRRINDSTSFLCSNFNAWICFLMKKEQSNKTVEHRWLNITFNYMGISFTISEHVSWDSSSGMIVRLSSKRYSYTVSK